MIPRIIRGAHDDVAVNEALHGFSYRRLYLTTDATISEIQSRLRWRPMIKIPGAGADPFVKDLWVDWNYAGDHSPG